MYLIILGCSVYIGAAFGKYLLLFAVVKKGFQSLASFKSNDMRAGSSNSYTFAQMLS
jgi:hypothetical protein